ncbi:hypothetical protein FB567DRAFT_599059 [Paraphoma chrysanthemicola]|uniref:Uncharacterized protein n=1 Tax=Paraphoma chrysanthemicola TaxID=798071 RepID=A0A8K0QSX1_9PLEO|nr:hypothetical protein FB567DRAFT_599059 [Paraphoma chrysanthemicola]
MSSISTPSVPFDGASKKHVVPPKSAEFLMAMRRIDLVIRDHRAAYNDPASTDEQRRAIDIREDMETWIAAMKACGPYGLMHNDKEYQLRVRANAMSRRMASMTSNGQMVRQDAIPMRLQIQYWILAIMFVLACEITIRHSVAFTLNWLLPLAAGFGLLLSNTFREAVRTHPFYYWYVLYNLSVLTGLSLEPAMHVLSTEPATDRQLLLLRWCMAYFIISEAEWHRHVHEAIEHPIGRDLLPTKEPGLCKGLGIAQAFARYFAPRYIIKLFARNLLATLTGLSPVILLRTIGDVPEKSTVWIPFHGDAFYLPSWIGINPQYLVLTRPIKHLMARQTDRIFEIGVLLWSRVRTWCLNRYAGVP